MSLKTFPYKGTCLIGLLSLGSVLWSDVGLGPLAFLFVLIFVLCLFVSIVVSIVLAAFQRSKSSLYRVLINVVVCLLFFPTIRVGDMLRTRLFLAHLAKFQEVTDLLIKDHPAHVNSDASVSMMQLPPGYSSLYVADHVLINSAKENITIRYISRDSSALGHRGYMYRSDDDTAALSKEFPNLGYTRVAPHWFFFSD